MNDIERSELILFPKAMQGGDDIERCIACDVPLKDGDRVFSDVSGGSLHEGCCGPEPESYVGEDGEPLKPGDPIPKPYIWSPWPKSVGDI